MAIDVSALATYSDEDQLKIVKVAIAEVTFYGKSHVIRERELVREDLESLMKLRDDLESRINRAAGGRVVNYAKRVRD